MSVSLNSYHTYTTLPPLSFENQQLKEKDPIHLEAQNTININSSAGVSSPPADSIPPVSSPPPVSTPEAQQPRRNISLVDPLPERLVPQNLNIAQSIQNNSHKNLNIVQKISEYAKKWWHFFAQKALSLMNSLSEFRKRFKLSEIKSIDIKSGLNRISDFYKKFKPLDIKLVDFKPKLFDFKNLTFPDMSTTNIITITIALAQMARVPLTALKNTRANSQLKARLPQPSV